MRIPRLHLFELEDQSWFPRSVRDLATDYLHFVEHRFALHLHALPILARVIEQSGASRVVDLCSGGAGPVPALASALRDEGYDLHFTLTDLFPNTAAFEKARSEGEGRIDFVDQPVDARRVPPELEGLRTLFNAFHHFSPADAAAIVRAAVDDEQPIAVMEIPDRRVTAMLPLVLTPLIVWLTTPFIRPMSWRRLLLTYPLPAVPLTCWWDGIVSQFRAYRPEELRRLAEEAAGASDYVWETGHARGPSAPGRLTYLIGWPGAARTTSP